NATATGISYSTDEPIMARAKAQRKCNMLQDSAPCFENCWKAYCSECQKENVSRIFPTYPTILVKI
ncbi:MAG: hypothetical protein MJA29_05740, partial [Candidatus Omnitrophica bacterium]|nr:hypothetical protein [Candidatus Omnitrophota bacterium]